MKKTLVFIETNATGHGIRAISVAKSLGYRVVFVAQNPEFYDNSKGNPIRIADELMIADTYDISEIERCLYKIGKVDGVIAFDDYHLFQAAEVAFRRGLPHSNLQGLLTTRFKNRTREKLLNIGEKHPQFAVLNEEQGLPPNSPIGYPCVLKPVDDSGSVGVKVCNRSDEFQLALTELSTRDKNVRGYRLHRQWLVEEYISGGEFSAELVWSEGKWRFIGITKKLVSEPPYFVELGHVFPYFFESSLQDKVRLKIYEWLEAVNLRGGAAHVEFKIYNNEPVLIEINPRLGGDLITELVRFSTGVDLVKQQLLWFLNEEMIVDWDNLQYSRTCAIRFVTAPRQGVIREIKALPWLSQSERLIDISLKSGPLSVKSATSSYDRLGSVLVYGVNVCEAEEQAEKHLSAIQFTWEE